jgi:hypothetical protein
MKPLFIILTVIASVFATNSYAETPEATPGVIKLFNNKFYTATDVNWSTNQGMYVVDFVTNDHHATAYYDNNGELIAVIRNISSDELPMALQNKLKKNYNGYWITNLIEATNEEGTSYYVTLENADHMITLESTPTGWSTFLKSKK